MSEASCVVCAGGVGTVCNDVWKEKKNTALHNKANRGLTQVQFLSRGSG